MAGRRASQAGRTSLLRRRGFAGDESGVTVIEFALLALPFFSILGAILETALVFMSGQALESAVQDTGRLIRTGQAQQANVTPAEFKTLICERLFGLVRDCNALHVEVDLVDAFGNVDFTPPVRWECEDPEEPSCTEWTRPESYTPGGGSSIVMMQVYYRWPVVVPFGGLGLANLPGGQRLLGAATVFRNEPFT